MLNKHNTLNFRGQIMEHNAEFEQFIDLLAELIEKYGREVLSEIEANK